MTCKEVSAEEGLSHNLEFESDIEMERKWERNGWQWQ